jgi:hypothetical protein
MMRRAIVVLILSAILAVPAAAQLDPPPKVGDKTATVAAGTRYQGGGLRRFFLGDTYRDLWATPITVPVLNISTYAGGLRPTKMGGGAQTKSVRFLDARGSEYVFRLVDKDNQSVPEGFEGSIIESISRDQVSAHHPGSAMVAAELLDAVDILHVTPRLFVMPDDPLLGEFREEFAGKLGMIEAYPNKPDNAPGFGGAIEVIDTDSLMPLLDRTPAERIDPRAYLTARLMDMLMNDWDRHPGNWKWGRMQAGGAWQPIPRDRDKAMIEYGGMVAVAGKASPKLVRFRETYPKMRGLTWNSLELDRRVLSGLEKPVWDSVAAFLVRRVTDPVIDNALGAMPPEYLKLTPGVAAIVKARRDQIPEQADRFYRYLAGVVDLHATDATDRASITLMDDRFVDVELRSERGTPYFHRRFDALETSEVRLYLHGGDDRATVRGTASPALQVRVIGGNGTNQLTDSSSSAGRSGGVRLYENGTVTGIEYGKDPHVNRRPLVDMWGHMQEPGKDRGGKLSPIVGLSATGDLGVVPRLGINIVKYGFRTWPYASRTALIGEYATGIQAFRVTGLLDRRREGSSLHLTAVARMSEIEIVNFRGLGNDSPDGPLEFFEARQRQWLLHPAMALALGPRSDLFLGPMIQYSSTDSIPDRFISENPPYGFGDFGQAGLRLGLYSDGRNRSRDPTRGLLIDATATLYPALWDVNSTFGVLSATGGLYITLPVPVHPILALRAGAKKVFGDFPFHEAAFIGGRGSVRRLDRERYGGDAALHGTAELQVPVAEFGFLLPLDVGLFGYADAGRVYLDGESPGGWHRGAGVGFWVGVLNPATAISFEFGDQRGRTGVRIRTGLSF